MAVWRRWRRCWRWWRCWWWWCWWRCWYGGGAGAGGAGGSGGGAAGEQPPEEPTPVGAFRFNTDTLKLEYYDGNQWVNVTTDSPEQHTGGTRGLSWWIRKNAIEYDTIY